MHDRSLPVIFIFDLDHTLIGIVKHILAYEQLLTYIKNGCKHKRIEGESCKLDLNAWSVDNVPHGLVRPHLKESLNAIKDAYPTAEFFIFSLGIKSYVQSAVEYLEKVCSVKFNRPLYTRDNGSYNTEGGLLKDLNGYYQDIFSALSTKYPKCKSERYQNAILRDRIIIVDDNKLFWNNNTDVVTCKGYFYTPMVEIDKDVLDIIYKNKLIHTYSNNNDKNTILPSIYDEQSYEQFKMNYHMFLANAFRMDLQNNVEYSKDTFFLDFAKVIAKRKHLAKPFTKSYLKSLNKTFG